MPDSNSFAERQHSASQARAESLYDCYGEDVIQSIVDELFDGKKVCGMTVDDFCEETLTFCDIGALLCAASRDDQIARLDAIRERVTEHIRRWCAGSGADYVWERVKEWSEPL